jgi:hypothetical protein
MYNNPEKTQKKPEINRKQTANKPSETAGTTPKSRFDAVKCYSICSEQQKISNLFNTCTVKKCPFRKKENPLKIKSF